jgi:hypothetical protein
MNREWLMILAMTSSATLGAIGGTGLKWARRFLLPGVLALVCIWAGLNTIRSLAMAVCMVVGFSLPYGERTPYWVKFLVACTWVASALWIGFTPWMVVAPVTFVGMFWLSNYPRTARFFPWKIVEFVSFGLVGVVVAHLISKA